MRYEKRAKRSVIAPDNNPTAQKIILAARELYFEKGFKKVTTRDIAAKAEVNLGLIPYYFGSKENLANVVYRQLKSEMYQSILSKVSLDSLTAAEQLYVYTVLRWEAVESSPEIEFMHEYLAEGGSDLTVSDEFAEMSWRIIREYGLDITLNENEIYLTALAGTEQLLILRMKRGELNITYRRILDLLFSNYFFNLGLPDEEIEKIITNSKNYLEKHKSSK